MPLGGQRRLPAGLLWGSLLCWAAVILYLSSLSPDQLPDIAFDFWDKFNHFVAFSIGGFLAAVALRASAPNMPATRALAVAVLVIAAFGVLDEALQTLTPGRFGADVGDWTADVLGAGTGAWVAVRRAL